MLSPIRTPQAPGGFPDGIRPVFLEVGAAPTAGNAPYPPGSVARFGTAYYLQNGTLATPVWTLLASVGSTPGPPVVIDATGLAATVPLLVKNGKTGSGVEIQVTGTAATGVVINNSSGTRKGALGLAVSANDWYTGAAAGDLVLVWDSAKKLDLAPDGAANVTATIDGSGVTIAASKKLLVDGNASLTNVAFQINNDANTGVGQIGGADTISLVAGGIEVARALLSGSTPVLNIGTASAINAFYQLVTDSRTWLVSNGSFGAGDDVFAVQNVGSGNRALTVGPTTGDVVLGIAAAVDTAPVYATGATTGMVILPTCAGTPTGAVPDGSHIIDTTAAKLWVRIGGAWKSVALV